VGGKAAGSAQAQPFVAQPVSRRPYGRNSPTSAASRSARAENSAMAGARGWDGPNSPSRGQEENRQPFWSEYMRAEAREKDPGGPGCQPVLAEKPSTKNLCHPGLVYYRYSAC
jgi:hypothetical protein